MNEIGPDYGLDAADRRVNRRDDGHEDNAPNVGIEIDRQAWKQITPDHYHDSAAKIQTNADSQHARKQEDAACHVLGFCSEAHGEKLVDALHPIVVVRLDEGESYKNARQDRPNDELAVKVSPRFETFGRRSKKSGGAGFGCNDGSENCPPGNRSPTKREIPQVFISSARPQTKRDYAEEIKEQDCGNDCQTGAHLGGYLVTAPAVTQAQA